MSKYFKRVIGKNYQYEDLRECEKKEKIEKYGLMKCFERLNYIQTNHIIKSDNIENIYDELSYRFGHFYNEPSINLEVMYIIYETHGVGHTKFDFYNFDMITDDHIALLITPKKLEIDYGNEKLLSHFFDNNPAICEIYNERKMLKEMNKKDIKEYVLSHGYIFHKRHITKKAMINDTMKSVILNVLDKHNITANN